MSCSKINLSSMDKISAFISYASTQKIIGGKLRSCLIDYCGYEVFIAHTDIPGSKIWEEEIIKAIKNADLFIPLISNDFKISEFTDQETGIAINLKKKIFPIKLGKLNPYGFINKYQALQYKIYPPGSYQRDNMKELALTIAQIALSYERRSILYQKAINSIVKAFCKSGSFDTANATIEIITKCNFLSENNLNEIVNAIKTNDQIKGAFGLSKLKTFLLKSYKTSID